MAAAPTRRRPDQERRKLILPLRDAPAGFSVVLPGATEAQARAAMAKHLPQTNFLLTTVVDGVRLHKEPA